MGGETSDARKRREEHEEHVAAGGCLDCAYDPEVRAVHEERRRVQAEVQARFNTREDEPDGLSKTLDRNMPEWREDFPEPAWHKGDVAVGVDHTPNGTAVVTARRDRETGIFTVLDSTFDASETDYVPSVESTPDYIRRLIRERDEARARVAQLEAEMPKWWLDEHGRFQTNLPDPVEFR